MLHMLHAAASRDGRTVQGDRQQRATILCTHRAWAARHYLGQQVLHLALRALLALSKLTSKLSATAGEHAYW